VADADAARAILSILILDGQGSGIEKPWREPWLAGLIDQVSSSTCLSWSAMMAGPWSPLRIRVDNRRTEHAEQYPSFFR
jgi:hypothetical protein